MPPVLQPTFTPTLTTDHIQSRLDYKKFNLSLLVAEFIIAVQVQQDNYRGREDVKGFDMENRKVPVRGKSQGGNELSISQALSPRLDTTSRNEKESKIWSRTCVKGKPDGKED